MGLGIRNKLSRAKHFAINVKNDGYAATMGRRDYNKRKAENPFTDIDYDEWKKQHRLSRQNRSRQKKYSAECRMSGPAFIVMVDVHGKSESEIAVSRGSLAVQTYKPVKVFYGAESAMKDKLAEYKEELSGREYWVLKMHAGDVLSPEFFYSCVRRIEKEDADIWYTDHELFSDTGRNKVCLKPDFTEDYLCAYDYIQEPFIAKQREPETMEQGTREYILSQFNNGRKIGHIAKCIYTIRAEAEEKAPENIYAQIKEMYQKTKGYTLETVATKKVAGLDITQLSWKEKPVVSVLIPNKDHIDDLDKCLKALEKQSIYNQLEIIVVENNSTDAKTFEYYDGLKNNAAVKVLFWPDSFNYSAINNFAAKESKGEFLLLLNNDVELMNEDALEQMLSMCMLDRVGMVGAKLYYEDNTVQHGGVVVGFQGVGGHSFVGLERGNHGYMNMADCPRRVSAVTAACLMMPRKVYDLVEGFDERYAVAFNDVDLCMKVGGTGKQIIYLPMAEAHHYESKTRGNDTTEEQVARFGQEVTTFLSVWQQELAKGDPYYNVNKSLNNMSEDRFRDIYSEAAEN